MVGAVLGISFYTDGKPFRALMDEARGPAQQPAPAPAKPLAAAQCRTDFPMSPQVAAALRANRPIRIGIFGDSFGDGIWAGTLQELAGRKNFKVYHFSKESTGLTRYQSLNILEDVKRRIAEQPVDVALFSFGANDTQGVWVAGKPAAYMTPAWKDVIGGRARDIVQLLQQNGVAVGWIGLPRMRRPKFDEQIQQMNGFYAGVMCDLGVPFVNPVSMTQGPDGGFSRDLVDPETGKKYLARADDGIHMSVHGYRVIVRPLLKKVIALAPDQPPAPTRLAPGAQ
ncbi:MAG: GDSL-type esterase/lipase family protein [Chakrabartia sp.]